MLTALLLLWVGCSLSTWLIPRCSSLERVAWTLLLAMSVTSTVVASLGYGLGLFIDHRLVVLVASSLALLLAPHALARLRSQAHREPAPRQRCLSKAGTGR